MDALDAAEKRNDELVASEWYKTTTAYGVQASTEQSLCSAAGTSP